MTYYNYISFYLFFIFVLCYLFLEIESFTPGGRCGHSSVLVGEKLYFFGGGLYNISDEAFYLDVSREFNIVSPPLYDLPRMPAKRSWGGASYVDNEHAIYLFGGYQNRTVVSASFALAYRFSLNSQQWEAPTIKEIKRAEMEAIGDNSGKIYIFGGVDEGNFFNDMITVNVVESTWSISYPSNAPQLAGYSATLLSNGVIVYIGGYYIVNGAYYNVDISQIYLYNTKSSMWSVKKTNPPEGQFDNRDSHKAVLVSSNKIIIHGGSKIIGNNLFLFSQITPDIAVLNTETFEWTIPMISLNIGVPSVPSLTAHTANLVGDYMIVAFGNVTQPNADPASINGKIYIMDIRNYTWVNTFKPSIPSSSTSVPMAPTAPTAPSTTNTSDSTQISQTSELTTLKVAIIIIGVIVGTAVIATIGFFGYKRYRRNEIMRIYGNNQ